MEVAESAIVLTKENIKSLCINYLPKTQEQDLEILSYEFKNIGEAPIGFLGRHQYLTVLIQQKQNNIKNQEKLKFFVKSAPIDVPAHMSYIEDFGVFKKEVNVYKYLLPRLEDINIGNGRFSPKCLLVKPNLLVFENLSDQGFRLANTRNTILDFNHLNCVMLALAKMHSASIILEYRTKRQISDLYKNCIEENAYPDNSESIRSIVFQKATNALCSLIILIPKYKTSSELNRILDEFRKFMVKIFELCKPSKEFRNVFNHGDLWSNNIMFRYDKNDLGQPIECRLVDFQLGRYGPPILDVITVLTIPTTSDFRRNHLRTLLNNYYSFLENELERHGLNVEDFISKTEFEESIEYYKIVGLIESCLFSHLTILPTELTTNLISNSDKFDEFLMKHRNEICQKAFETDSIYRERMTDMITEIIDLYILNK